VQERCSSRQSSQVREREGQSEKEKQETCKEIAEQRTCSRVHTSSRKRYEWRKRVRVGVPENGRKGESAGEWQCESETQRERETKPPREKTE